MIGVEQDRTERKKMLARIIETKGKECPCIVQEGTTVYCKKKRCPLFLHEMHALSNLLCYPTKRYEKAMEILIAEFDKEDVVAILL